MKNLMAYKNLSRVLVYSFLLVLSLAVAGFVILLRDAVPEVLPSYPPPSRFSWSVQSVDTMKYSRDRARESLNNPAFDQIIESQIGEIAESGANTVALGTPYDEEFLPVLKRWVDSARRHKLHIWFRGNFSGWEGWFEYPRISPEEHIAKTDAFIRNHPELFADGDLFSSCPECENGSWGDPRMVGNTEGYRRFLLQEYAVSQAAFLALGKSVDTRYFSMNADVARLVMDQTTTRALGGRVTIDHYVNDPARLVSDIDEIARESGGEVMLGEFGAPIPDIHGSMTSEQQAQWLALAMTGLSKSKALRGVNYWTNTGSSTALWDDGQARPGSRVLKTFFQPISVSGFVLDELGRPVNGASIRAGNNLASTDQYGHFVLRLYNNKPFLLNVSAPGFHPYSIKVQPPTNSLSVVLKPDRPSMRFRLTLFLQKKFLKV